MKKKFYLKDKKIRELIKNNKRKDTEKSFNDLLKRAVATKIKD